MGKCFTFFTAILILLLSSCSEDDKPNSYETDLVGTWKFIEDREHGKLSNSQEFYITISFFSDRTGVYHFEDRKNNTYEDWTFEWSANEHRIGFTRGYETRYESYSISNPYLYFYFLNGDDFPEAVAVKMN